MKKALAASEAKVQQLMKVNNSLSDELRRLQREVGVGPTGLPSSVSRLLLADVFPLLPRADPQAASREHTDPAADWSCPSNPGPQRAAGARAPPGHSPPAPPGPPGLLHVRAGLSAETLWAAGGGAGDTAPALQPWCECAGLAGRVLGCSSPPAPRGAGSGPHGAVTFRVSPGGGGRGSVLHAHPGQRVPGKGAAAGAAPAWDVVAVGCPGMWPLGCPVPLLPCTPLGQARDLPKPQQLRDVPACRVAVSPVLVLPCTSPGSAPHPSPPRSPWASPLFPLQIRKGASASSMPFPPSSPLLSCPPDGARHMVMYQGGGAILGVGRLPVLCGDRVGQGLTLHLSLPEQTGPARQRH